jgi:hypothetical protein
MSTQPPLQLSEAEMAFQAVVDPYARADFFFSAGPEGFAVEEGFITFNTLPGKFLVKVGQMRASFGKVNTLHTHAMPTVDRTARHREPRRRRRRHFRCRVLGLAHHPGRHDVCGSHGRGAARQLGCVPDGPAIAVELRRTVARLP